MSLTVEQLNTSQIAQFMCEHSRDQSKINRSLDELNSRKSFFTGTVCLWTAGSEAWFNEFITELQKLFIMQNNLEIFLTENELNFIGQMKTDVIDYKTLCEMSQ